MAYKLSQLVFYVDKRMPFEGFCAYCTKVIETRPDIWFTYICYDNQSPCEIEDKSDELYESLGIIGDFYRTKITNKMDYELLVKSHKENSLLLISDREDVTENAAKYNIPRAALLNEYNTDALFKNVRYCISDIAELEFYHIERIWQRYNHIPWIIAESPRLIIREQTIEDVDEIFKIYEDPEATLYMEGLSTDKDRELQYMKDYIDKQYRFYEYGIWALVEKVSGKLIGRAGIYNRDGYDDVEIGYIIRKDMRKKGYAYEAVSKIIEYAEYELDIKTLNAFTSNENAASIGLLRKLNFYCMESCIIDAKPYLRFVRNII